MSTDTTTTTTKSFLTKKDRELHYRAQIKKLHNIANRAMKKADHMTELVGGYYTDMVEDAVDDAERVKAVAARTEAAAEVWALQAKAAAAAEEMLAIARANNDPRVANFK
jgi:hypothetical protein